LNNENNVCDNAHGVRVMAHRPLYTLSEENLKVHSMREVDTWPFSPKTELISPSQGMSQRTGIQINQWLNTQTAAAEKTTDNFSQRRQLGISWVLGTIAIGLVANMLATALLGEVSTPNIELSVALGCILLLLAWLFFRYYPTTYNHSIQLYFQPIPILQPLPQVQTSQLNAMNAQIQYPYSFQEDFEKFMKIVTLCLIRDSFGRSFLETLRVVRVDDYWPLIILTIDLKRQRDFFLDTKLIPNVESDVRYFLQQFVSPQIQYSVYDYEIDTTEWMNKGHTFLNLLFTWDLNQLTNDIIAQICG